MSDPGERLNLKKGKTRREVLELALGLGAAAIPGLANAQDQRTYMEAGREITITPQAEQKMREWGIELKGSEITAPPHFKEGRNGKSFPGICLTSNARKVAIGLWPAPVYVGFMVFNSDNSVEFISFHDDRTYSVERQAKGYTEGHCEKEIS